MSDTPNVARERGWYESKLVENLNAEVERLQAENERLKAERDRLQRILESSLGCRHAGDVLNRIRAALGEGEK